MEPRSASTRRTPTEVREDTSVRIVTCSASSIPGINNFGDELLTEIYHRWIREHDPSLQPVHLRINPLAPISAANRKLIAGAACLVFTGGGYFADGYASRFALKGQLRSLRNRNIYWRAFEQAERSGVPCAVLGLEVGPVTSPSYRRAVRRILEAAKYVVVRNRESVTNTREMTGGVTNPALFLDAAFSLGASLLPEPDPVEPHTVRVGLHIHSRSGMEGWDALIDLIRKEIGESRPMRLIFLYDQRKRDEPPPAWVEVEKAVLSRFPEAMVVQYESPSRTIEELRGLDLVLTSKLHVGIVSRALGVPALLLGHHAKIRRCFASIGEEHLCGSPGDFVRRGLPAEVAAAVNGSGPARIPCPEAAVRSALGNRDILRQMLQVATGGR